MLNILSKPEGPDSVQRLKTNPKSSLLQLTARVRLNMASPSIGVLMCQTGPKLNMVRLNIGVFMGQTGPKLIILGPLVTGSYSDENQVWTLK